MSSAVSKYIALLSLLIFLSPAVIEGLHDLRYSKADRCTEKTEKHLHNKFHHCLICGTSAWLGHYFASNSVGTGAFYIKDEFIFGDFESSKSSILTGILLRAPPLFEYSLKITNAHH